MKAAGDAMRVVAAVVLALSIGGTACQAEPRWCTITGRGANDMIVYPPIARAARVQGVVLGRVVYTPAGRFVRFEPISGPAMLSQSVEKQLATWSLKTNAIGDELCESPVIAQFQFNNPDYESPTVDTTPAPPSAVKVSITVEVLVIIDPVAEYSKNPITRFARRVRWLTHKVSQH